MSKYNDLQKESQLLKADLQSETKSLEHLANRTDRLSWIAWNAEELISDIDAEFAKITGLSPADISFLLLATALQCVRQYLFTNFPERVDDKTAAKRVKKPEEHSNRGGILYRPSLEEILSNPVPFDAINGSPGALKGGKKLGHRATAIGHDPIVGLIVGTANIATATLTTWNMASYHIQTVNKRDTFWHSAKTSLVFAYTKTYLLDEGTEGKVKIANSLLKEVVHLQSDVQSKVSLPLPFVSLISPDLAGKMAEYGLDWGNTVQIGKQAAWAQAINIMIAMLHRMLFSISGDTQEQLYEVRTRKILSYSNLIATSSNVLAVGAMEVAAYYSSNAELGKKGLQYLDLGGLAVTLYRLLSDQRFIKSVKKEFLEKHWYELVAGEYNV